MVVLDNPTVYDVVFVVEGTANLGAYFDTLKTNYILPTLEYFNGGPPDEVDYGCDYSCSLYSLVVFYGADCVPGPAATCVAPTTSTHEFIQRLDKIDFAGGNGETNSHMSEGFATALQLFDDLEKLREPNVTTQKHCILVCNSMPFQLTSQESFNYSGFTTEQLVAMMPERNLNFSMLSPRKIPVLYRLFDKGSGDSQTAVTMQNYATDSRHLVLLMGYQLQVRPTSPGAKKEEMTLDLNKAPPVSSGGMNRGTPSPVAHGAAPRLPGPSPDRTQGAPGGAGEGPGHTAAQEAAKQILEQQNRGRSMMSPGQPIPSPTAPNPLRSQTTLQEQLLHRNQNIMKSLGGQGSQPLGSQPLSTQQGPQGGLGPTVMTSQQQPMMPMMSSQQPMMTSQQQPMMMSQQQTPMSSQGLVNTSSAPVVSSFQGQAPPPFSQARPMVPQRGPQPMHSMLPGNMGPGGGMMTNPTMGGPQATLGGGPPQPHPGGAHPGGIPGSAPGMNLQGVDINNPAATLERSAQVQQRNIIWSGALEWSDKSKGSDPQPRPTRTLPCHVSAIGPDTDLNATKWPAKLVMQLIPQTLLQPLQPLFKNSRTVNFQFAQSQDRESLINLYKVMASGFAGCVHFPSTCDVRVLMLLYSNRKKQFMGLIPNDQAKFVNGIRAVITKHKQATQSKMQMQGGPGGLPPGGGAMGGPGGGAMGGPVGGAMGGPGGVPQAGSSIGGPGGLPQGGGAMGGPGNLPQGGGGMQGGGAMPTGFPGPPGPMGGPQQTAPQVGGGMVAGGMFPPGGARLPASAAPPSTASSMGGVSSMGVASTQGMVTSHHVSGGPSIAGGQVSQPAPMETQSGQTQQTSSSQQPGGIEEMRRQNQQKIQSLAQTLATPHPAPHPHPSTQSEGSIEDIRRMNQQKIQSLTQTLEAAKQQELAFQKAEQQKKVLERQQQQLLVQQQQQNQTQLRLQQLQQQQAQQQQQQQQQQAQAQQPMMQQPQTTNQQLRHLLLNQQQQQQQMRSQQQMMMQRMRGPGPQPVQQAMMGPGGQQQLQPGMGGGMAQGFMGGPVVQDEFGMGDLLQ